METLLAPYIVPLTTEEREQIPKTSDKTIAFVTKTFDYTGTNPEFVPNFMNTAEFKTDVDNYNTLKPLLTQANQLVNNIQDTAMISGSEAFISALQYYNFVKQGEKNNVQNAKAIYEDLAVRFPGTRKKPAPAPVA